MTALRMKTTGAAPSQNCEVVQVASDLPQYLLTMLVLSKSPKQANQFAVIKRSCLLAARRPCGNLLANRACSDDTDVKVSRKADLQVRGACAIGYPDGGRYANTADH